MADAVTEPAGAVEDLEDGEIESDGEEIEAPKEDKKEDIELSFDDKPIEEKHHQPQVDLYHSKPGKKKKSKSKGEKFKDKNKKNRKHTPLEDDFLGNIEKAIRKAMNKQDDRGGYGDEGPEERRRFKKRKKYDKDGPSKKRKKTEYSDDMDESEMMCVRGASPVQRQSPADNYPDDDKDSYESDSSAESRGRDQHHRPQRHRQQQRDRNKNNKNDWRRPHPMQDPDGVCLYYMQGKCHKGDDCIYSHDAQPPRKMELCKFYLMDCCAKRDKCLYMHADFPCKYYHTGLPCIYKDECKFAHGPPLTENLKNILLKHIESAPKEILGDFPRLNREGALKMMQTTQAKLMQQFNIDCSDNQDKGIPSLFELNIPNPQNAHDTPQINNFGNDRQPKVSPKVRQSRWQIDSPNNQNFNTNLSPGGNASASNVLNIKNLTGVLTTRQISDLTRMGIETLDQLGRLTVLQLNSIGISLKQITEIQMNTMSIQKLGLINSNTEQQTPSLLIPAVTKDLDLRVPPAVPETSRLPVSSELPGQDIDMRFQPSIKPTVSDDSIKVIKNEIQPSKDMIDIDQYTKDALKFVSKDKENIDISNETFENEAKLLVSTETKDVDHRVLPFSDEGPKVSHTIVGNSMKKECDTDIRFLQPEPIFKSPEKRHRRSTTDDDEENNLLIDEKWYSSDEEKGIKKKSPASSPRPASMSPQQPVPPVIEPSSVLSKLGDLSKIDISEEVTKLLNTMKNIQENKFETISEPTDSRKLRDPRSNRSPDKITESKKTESTKVLPKRTRISIYECVEGEPTDGRRRSDVDLRKSDFPGFGDTDLRQTTSRDIDLRLGLPFKAIPNYTPASEIDGSINSHPPIPYKLAPIDIPRPDYTDIRNSTAKSQALLDPRLRKVFRLSLDESGSDSEKATKSVATGPRVDPRRKQTESADGHQDQKSNSLDIQTILQNSNWFKDLSSNQKISVNQHLMPVIQVIKQFQQDKTQGKNINENDLISIQSNAVVCSIFTNLGVTLGENGEFAYLPKPKEALLKTPINFSPTGNPFGMNSGVMDATNMNMMNMPSMGVGGMNNMNVGPIHGFNQPMSDPRGGPTPGLLGIAPNIPHNFNAFSPNNFGNMGFNGPNGPGGNFIDGDQNYPRFPNRGGHRGRGNDRWNRGNAGRGGNRDRKNYNDRGNWKNDRH